MIIGFLLSWQLIASSESSWDCRQLMQLEAFQSWIDQMNRPEQLFTAGRSFVGLPGVQKQFVDPVSELTRAAKPTRQTYEGVTEVEQLRRLYFLFGAEPSRIASLLDEQLPFFHPEAPVDALVLIRAKQFMGNPSPAVLRSFFNLLIEKDWVQHLAGEPESIFFWRKIYQRRRALTESEKQSLFLALMSAAREHRRRAETMSIPQALELKNNLTSGGEIFPSRYEEAYDFLWAQATHLDHAVELSRMAEALATSGSGFDKPSARSIRVLNEQSLHSIQSRYEALKRIEGTGFADFAVRTWTQPRNFP